MILPYHPSTSNHTKYVVMHSPWFWSLDPFLLSLGFLFLFQCCISFLMFLCYCSLLPLICLGWHFCCEWMFGGHFSQPMATPCLRGLLWKQEQKQKVNWGSSGALRKILSHGLKLLQGARKDWEFGHIWGHPAVPALALTESFLSASLHLQCAGSSLILWSTRAWCLFVHILWHLQAHPSGVFPLSGSVLLVGSSAQSHRGVDALELNRLRLLQCSSAHSLYSTGEFGLCLCFSLALWWFWLDVAFLCLNEFRAFWTLLQGGSCICLCCIYSFTIVLGTHSALQGTALN